MVRPPKETEVQPYMKRHAGYALGLRGVTHALVVLLAVGNIAWLDPVRDALEEGNRLFQAGQFEEALTRYGELLVDDPDSPLVNFNMGAAHYKAGNYDAALSSFARVPSQDDAPPRAARTAYNLGNTQYQIGAATEAAQPQAALKAYTSALSAYRRALGLNPSDEDAKFNYEVVAKKIEQLKDQMQQQNQLQYHQPGRPQPNQGHHQPERQPAQPDNQDQRQDQPSALIDRRQEPAPGREQSRSSAPQQSDESDMSEEEASALIDTAKSEELRAEEFIRQAQDGVVTEPLEDW